MNGPTLLIMAAGLGSRFGGMKQIAPLDPEHHIIMDFSIYDAMRAGFSKVVLIIKEEHRQDFEDTIGARVAGMLAGTLCPVVLSSRSDNADDKFLSLAVALFVASHQHT